MSRILLFATLLGTIGLIIFLSGVGLPATLVIISTLGGLLWVFTRKPRPEREMPSNTVSCCHYLGDSKDERPPQPR